MAEAPKRGSRNREKRGRRKGHWRRMESQSERYATAVGLREKWLELQATLRVSGCDGCKMEGVSLECQISPKMKYKTLIFL